MPRCLLLYTLYLLVSVSVAAVVAGEVVSGFLRSPWFGEQVRLETLSCGARVYFNLPQRLDPSRPTRVLFYATPNGNTIEQTLGARTEAGMDWHFDIQHIAAQTRRLREVDGRENLVLVCVEAEGRSWPAWRRKHPDSAALIRQIVEEALERLAVRNARVMLAGHSGGGSFLFGFLDGGESIPAFVERVAFLDANYGYSDTERHGEKLLAWLRADPSRRLVILAYDDREVMLNGKPIVGPEGGTYRASHRMLDRFRKELPLAESRSETLVSYTGLDGRISVRIGSNPDKKILHTVLVGEWNGFLQAASEGTPEAGRWGRFGPPRAYTKWIQPAAATQAAIPSRPVNAPGGTAFMKSIADLPAAEREAAILKEIGGGNVPEFLRRFKPVQVTATDSEGREHTAVYEVMPDYLAAGSDADWVRVPMTPMTAQQIADRFGCALPTRKMVDDIYRQAEVRLEPRPLTEEREAVATFVRHHEIIEQQRAGKELGLLVAGIKKDVVVTNRLQEKPHRVAIYGWHQLDGRPIQPLTIVHRDTYVDYSHGIRLVRQRLTVDGRLMSLTDLLKDPRLSVLVSDEGRIEKARYEGPG